MFHVKLVARPDARMVEVPLEVEAELPREFEGAAMLASSGLPRKVRIKAPKDALKLSTAYRADQLLADVVRTVLRGTTQDVTRVQEAVAAFVRKVRERRQDGASLTVQSNGRGKIDVLEELPQPKGAKAAAAAAHAQAQAAPGPVLTASQQLMSDRVAALEKRLAQLEAGFSQMGGVEKLAAARAIEQRLAEVEKKLAAALREPVPQMPLSLAAQVASLPTPGAEGRARQNLRRGTAVDAFAEGLRIELRARAAGLNEAAQKASTLADRSAVLVSDAAGELGSAPEGLAETLRQASAEAGARQKAVERVADEVDLYAAADLPVAGLLLDRLAEPGEVFDPLEPLGALVLDRLRLGAGGARLSAWLARALPLLGWSSIEPSPGEPLRKALHEADGAHEGEPIGRVLVPGVRDRQGNVLQRTRVATARRDAEARAAAPPDPAADLPDVLEPEPLEAGAAIDDGSAAEEDAVIEGAALAEDDAEPLAEVEPEPAEDEPAETKPAAQAAPAEPAAQAAPAEPAAQAAPAEPAAQAAPAEPATQAALADPAAQVAPDQPRALLAEVATSAHEPAPAAALAAALAAAPEGAIVSARSAEEDTRPALATQVALAVETKTQSDAGWVPIAQVPAAFPGEEVDEYVLGDADVEAVEAVAAAAGEAVEALASTESLAANPAGPAPPAEGTSAPEANPPPPVDAAGIAVPPPVAAGNAAPREDERSTRDAEPARVPGSGMEPT